MTPTLTCAAGWLSLFLLLDGASAATRQYDVTHEMHLRPRDGDTQWVTEWGHAMLTEAKNSLGEHDRDKVRDKHIVGFIGSDSATIGSSVTGASSSSTVSASVNVGLGNTLDAVVTAKGVANADNPPRWTWAFASGTSVVGAAAARTSSAGRLRWRAVSVVSASGCTQPCVRVRDPIDFVARSLSTGETRSGTLLDIDYSLDQGSGRIDWTDGVLSIESGEAHPVSGSFSLDLDSPFTVQQGRVSFTFVDGIVTQSVATGVFEGKLPGVGRSAIGGFSLGAVELDYDFGFGNDPIALGLSFSNGGQADVISVVPEPHAALLAGGGVLSLLCLRRGTMRTNRASPLVSGA